MSTALQLVNRIRSKAREETITSFPSNDGQHDAILNELNDAKESVLHERTWSFQHRVDGVLTLKPTVTGVAAEGEEDDNQIDLANESINFGFTPGGGNFRGSLHITSSSTFADHTFDTTYINVAGNTAFMITDETIWEDFSGASWKWFTYQYTLPTTVSQVTGAWHQMEDNVLAFEDEVVNFRTLVPRPHENLGDIPRLVMPGWIAATGGIGSTAAQNPAYGIRIWPVPDTEMYLNYSYIYRDARFTDASDLLIGVPPEVESEVVDLAFANFLINSQNDIERGFPLKERVEREIQRKHKVMKMDPMRAKSMKSLNEIGARPNGLLRTHRTVASLSGV